MIKATLTTAILLAGLQSNALPTYQVDYVEFHNLQVVVNYQGKSTWAYLAGTQNPRGSGGETADLFCQKMGYSGLHWSSSSTSPGGTVLTARIDKDGNVFDIGEDSFNDIYVDLSCKR